MACEKNVGRATRGAQKNGINKSGSKSGFAAGSTAQVSFFSPNGNKPAKKKRKSPKRRKKRSGAQVSFFETRRSGKIESRPAAGTLPDRRQIKISNDFTPEELKKISIQLRLGAAAASRHLREMKASKTGRGIGHSDPRPVDWARQDQANFQFLANQVARAYRKDGYLDTSALNKEELVDLWEFARFEADRAHRNIDHLASGSHIKGPTADYLVDRHKQEARFYTFVAGQLEPMITPEMYANYVLD